MIAAQPSPRCFGYAVLSPIDQAQGVTPESIERQVRDFCRDHLPGFTFAAATQDQGADILGRELRRRPCGRLLSQVLRRGDALAFQSAKVFGSMRDALATLDWLIERGVQVAFLDHLQLSADPSCAIQLQVWLRLLRDIDRGARSERIQAAKKFGKANRNSPGRARPFGRVFLGKGRNSYPAWDEYELAILAEVVRLRAAGFSLENTAWAIEAELCRRDGRENANTLRYKSPHHKWTDCHGRTWKKSTVEKALKAIERDDELREKVGARPELFAVGAPSLLADVGHGRCQQVFEPDCPEC